MTTCGRFYTRPFISFALTLIAGLTAVMGSSAKEVSRKENPKAANCTWPAGMKPEHVLPDKIFSLLDVKVAVIHKPGALGQTLGEVLLEYDGHKIIGRKTRIIDITDDMPEDAAIKKLRRKYFDAFAADTPIGEVPREMDREAFSRWLAGAVRQSLGVDGVIFPRQLALKPLAAGSLTPQRLLQAVPAASATGWDWPMWRYDANRSAVSPHALPSELHLQWVREYPPLEPAWEEVVNRDRMPYDRVYEPVVMGTTMLIGSSRGDWVTAIDTRTGKQKWRFYTDGPVRLPPVAHNGKGYFTSDDGHLYCVDAETGRLVWKFRGGPADRKVLGNGRLVSSWPARGGPVISGGTIYFAASIWPFMGTFIHALDAETGKVVWTNEGMGSMYMMQPHGTPSFAGIAPQGAMAVIGDRLLVPGGRSVPACLDRNTGQLRYFHLAGSPGANRKLEGGSHVSAIGGVFFNHRGILTGMYDLHSGAMLAMLKKHTYPVLTEKMCYFSGNSVVACRLGKENKKKGWRWVLNERWKCDVDATGALIKAGNRLYAGGKNRISALELKKDGPAKVAWTVKVEGTVARLLAADARLFAVTLEGRIYAFGPKSTKPETFPTVVSGTTPSPALTKLARQMLETTTLKKGYCLAFGLEDGQLLEALVKNSDLNVIGVDPDPQKVARLRQRFQAAGLYGTRVSVHQGDPATFHAPPYLAVLTISESLATRGHSAHKTFIESLFRSMRPYGGVAWLSAKSPARRKSIEQALSEAGLAAKTRHVGDHVLLSREGPLPGAGSWTHQYGNIANTSKSEDRLVRLPLGLLWFGGNTHADILPRHGHGPPEQVIGGRLFIEGNNSLSARDVYTGKNLWKRNFNDLGTFGVYFDRTYRDDPLDTSYNQVHIPGANARGTNYVATADKVYLIVRDHCQVLHPATGKTLTTFSLPQEPKAKKKPTWGYIGVYEDLLIAGSQFVPFSQKYKVKRGTWDNFDNTSSRKLVVMDRHTGKVLWTRKSRFAFRHNAITAGHGKLFCIDSLPQSILASIRRRGETPKGKARILALDLKTGQTVWSTDKNVFGTWLSYDGKHDILIQSGRASADMIRGEPSNRMIAYRGKTGAVAWDKPLKHGGPCMIHGRTIYLNAVRSQGAAVDLLSGDAKIQTHPLTGQNIPWQYHRQYGCNSVNASEYLLTFRSGAAGYYDLAGEGGTGNMGGFKSGCTSNLVCADGVLNAPDYTRTCSCTYPNQASLAMVHMPRGELWTFNSFDVGGKRVKRMGINFGAPGDRRDAHGTLWLDYPSVGGVSPDVPIEIDPAPRYFRMHQLRLGGRGPAWVGASGLIGGGTISIKLGPEQFSEIGIPVSNSADDTEQNAAGKVYLHSTDLELTNDRGEQTVAMRFSPVPVPQGAKIKQAYIQFKVDEPSSGPASLAIHGQASDAAAAPKLYMELEKRADKVEKKSAIPSYTIRLHFVEPSEGLKSGDRIFDVALQGKTVLKTFDILAQAGKARQTIVKEFTSVPVLNKLHISLIPHTSAPPVLCGVEAIAEGN